MCIIIVHWRKKKIAEFCFGALCCLSGVLARFMYSWTLNSQETWSSDDLTTQLPWDLAWSTAAASWRPSAGPHQGHLGWSNHNLKISPGPAAGAPALLRATIHGPRGGASLTLIGASWEDNMGWGEVSKEVEEGKLEKEGKWRFTKGMKGTKTGRRKRRK